MLTQKTAKLFMNGNSQAVRLPLEYRFAVDEVFVTKNPHTGDVILSTLPNTNVWADFFEFTSAIADTSGYMETRELNTPPSATGIFDDVASDRKRKRAK
jgi:antitoxin VapB